MGHGVELDMSDVITKWGVKAERNLGNELVGDGVDHSYVLILQGNIRVIGADCNSRVTNKDPVIDLVVFDSVRAIIRVELDLSDGVKRALLANDVDDALSGVTDKDLAKIGSDYNASSLRHVDETDNLVQLGVEDDDVPISSLIKIGVMQDGGLFVRVRPGMDDEQQMGSWIERLEIKMIKTLCLASREWILACPIR